jgi:hypothetical protein
MNTRWDRKGVSENGSSKNGSWTARQRRGVCKGVSGQEFRDRSFGTGVSGQEFRDRNFFEIFALLKIILLM